MLRLFFPSLRRDRGILHTSVLGTERQSSKPRFENVRGRRIARDIPYLIPKDIEDANRLDFQHYMLKVALQGLYAAKFEPTKVRSILDVATGTGRWAMEMAHIFTSATIIGLDHVPPPSDDSTATTYDPRSRPANYHFVQGNMFDRLPFDDNSFDFVHMRLVYAAVPVDQWPPLVAELRRVTRPGGWMELVEGFIPIDTGPATATIISAIIETSKRRNIDLMLGKTIGDMMMRAGFHEVKQRTVFIPIGKKHGRVGNLCELDMLSVYKAIGANVVNAGVMDAGEWNRLFALMPGELDATTTVWPVFQANARKNGPIQRKRGKIL